MRSDIMRVIELVEAGQPDLAKDYVNGAKKELVSFLEHGIEDRTYEDWSRKIPDGVSEWFKKDPNFPGSTVTGFILIADVDHPAGSRLSLRTWGSMDKPANRIGTLQMVTTNQMEENL